ncbi:hypothetical protein [Falsiroseomonas tokyonensis]|uniref:Uncharacterized protein n=1 Tax=Falsiroseomonas tokyonensis TaxID=430521 RepID=A0ABV7BXI5_9PROT|nr:hypothetical protein [Falsiroseomonas tokyonensis]
MLHLTETAHPKLMMFVALAAVPMLLLLRRARPKPGAAAEAIID